MHDQAYDSNITKKINQQVDNIFDTGSNVHYYFFDFKNWETKTAYVQFEHILKQSIFMADLILTKKV